jgi:hypothetical protein
MDSALYESFISIAGPKELECERGFISLVDAQTGLGKTYQAIELQLNHLQSKSTKKIIYSTNLRINVTEAFEDLCERINKKSNLSIEQKKKYLENIIHIPSQENSVKLLSEDDWNLIYDDLNFRELRDVKAIKDGIKLLEQAFEASGELNGSALSEELSYRYSRLFKLVQAIYKEKLNNQELVENSAVHDVLIKLLPASRIKPDTAQIIFMTTAKLLFPWHALEINFRISDVMKESLIILDEFDRQQAEFLSHLLGNKSEFDIISIVRRLFSAFSSYNIDESTEFEGVNSSFDKFRMLLNEFDGQWHIPYRPVITDSTIQAGKENQKRVFTLLSDRMSLHAINFKHDELKSHIDTQQHIHDIGVNGQKSSIQYINNASQLIRAFCNSMLNATGALAKNISSIEGSKPHSSEDLIVKILNHFGLAEMKRDVIALLNARLSFRIDKEHKSYSYHDSGFEITKISKYSELDNTATATTFELPLTPTGLLANWVFEGAKILGISATASSKTTIHNFDLLYLSNLLGDQFKTLSPEQKQAIQQEYLAKRRYQENDININVRSISERDLPGGVRKLYREYCGGTIDDLMLETKIAELLNVDPNDHSRLKFTINRLNKLLAAIQQFSQHPTNRYLFCMLNNSFKSQGFAHFMTFVSKKYSVKISENINAASFRNNQFNQVKDILENTTEKVVVITNYQATGAGLSPSYDVKDCKKFIYIGQKDIPPYQQKTDIDAIYLEQPKSLIGELIFPFQTYDERTKAIKKNIHDALMLHEQGIIVPNDVKPLLNRFISSNVNSFAASTLIQLYQATDDYKYATYRFIEQALGRMCRTEWKQQEINIMYDAQSKFMETLALDNRDLSFLSAEYQQLIFAVKLACKVELKNKLESTYSAKATRNYAHINRLITSVYQHQNTDAIGQYNRLRTLTLESPTQAIMPTGEHFRYYVESKVAGSYTYHIDYSFEKQATQIFINADDMSSQRIVSGLSARLNLLMKNKIIKAHFETNSYATSFKDHNIIISPAMFDIYMGAIGEESVFALLQDFNVKVYPMPEGTTEWFDGYITIGDRILLIDVKHWNLETSCFDREYETSTKCKEKLSNINVNKPAEFKDKKIQALYINLIFDGKGTITGAKHSSQKNTFVEYANMLDADVIDIPGLIDIETGQANTPTMNELVNLLETLKGMNNEH